MSALLDFLKPPENQGMTVPESTLQSLDASNLKSEVWRTTVQGLFPHWHKVRTPLNGPAGLPHQLLLPFFYACPVGIDADLYQGLAEVVSQANLFLRAEYSDVAALVHLFSESFEQLFKPELRAACEQLGLWPFFRPDTINRYARLVHRQLFERVPNLMLDFALGLGPDGRACLVVTEMQATHPYFSFTRMVEAAAQAGLAPGNVPAWSGSDPARSLSELAQDRPVLVIDAGAGTPEGCFMDDLRVQSKTMGTGCIGPVALESVHLRDGEVYLLDLEGRQQNPAEFQLYVRTTLQEVGEVLSHAWDQKDYDRMRAVHRFFNGPLVERMVCLNLADQLLLGKANLEDFRLFLEQKGHPWSQAFLPQVRSRGGQLQLRPGKSIIKPCSGNSGKGLTRVMAVPAAEMPELLRQLQAQGLETKENQIRYPAECPIPVESRVDQLCPTGALEVGQESIAQPLFSQFRLGQADVVIELRACQTVGRSNFFLLARKAAPEAFSLDNGQIQATKVNYHSLLSSVVLRRLRLGGRPEEMQDYLAGLDIPERLQYGFTCLYPQEGR
ncbi:MAG: hypothetical protein J0I12_27505 [Candidatus Eremiobacteraeota bacterium]|nr:hypothetical protein [Candidatus Eremiobacteraeota bacterium]